MSTPTTSDSGAVAGTWSLTKVSPEPAAESMIIEELPVTPESVVGRDERKLVNPKDFAPGGKYRSIVKLQIRYEKQKHSDPPVMGTGWLVANQVVVTAGHCVYDWSHSYGRCTSVNAYIGYNGKDSVQTAQVQQRRGLKIVATGGWLKAAGNRQNDVAFIQLDVPFKNVTPIKFKSTPLTGNEEIGVVGYPGDKTFMNRGEEMGASMYEHFKQLKWNLDNTEAHMLEYDIDTFGGQSGSPVLVRESSSGRHELYSIGAHVYGVHGGMMTNSASTIDGLYGNSYAEYLAVMTNNTEPTRTENGINFVSLLKPNSQSTPDSSQEGWIDVLSGLGKAASTVGSIIQASSAFLGPIGPLAALASTALSAAGQMAAESDIGELQAGDDLTQRGILAEAALQTVLKMSQEKPKKVQNSGIYKEMLQNYEKMIPDAKAVAPRVLMSVVAPALSLAQNKNAAESEVETASDPRIKQLISINSGSQEEESFWGGLKSAAKTTFIITKKYGLSILKDIINGPAESVLTHRGTAIDGYFEDLSERAIMGEAALQAFSSGNILAQEEGFFDTFKEIVKTIGPQVISIAPAVLKDIVPIVGGLLSKA